MADYSEAYQQYKSEEARERRLRAEVRGRGMTGERLGSDAWVKMAGAIVNDDMDELRRIAAFEEAAPSTDEGGARWWVDTWCDKHDGFHLQHGDNGSRIVVADEESGEMVCQLLNEAAAIRTPLEERIRELEADVLIFAHCGKKRQM